MRSPTIGTGLLVVVLTAAAFAPAQAEPPDPDPPSASDVRAAQERAEAALTGVEALQHQLDAATARLDAAAVAAAKAAEAWNGARWRAAEARKAARTAARRAVRAEQVLAAQEAGYREAVITAHHSGLEVTALNALINADGVESLIDRSAAVDHVQALFDERQDAYEVAAADAVTAEAEAQRTAEDADTALAAARDARDAARAAAAAASATATRIAGRKDRLVRRVARLEGISVDLARERQTALEAERETARAAAAPVVTRSAPEPTRTPASTAPEPADEPDPPAAVPDVPEAPADPPPAAGGAQAAIAFARAQLGERYVWGAAGPNAWDCSGLTSKAWAAGGKYLPHYSVAQYEQSTPVSVGQLRPGDLVFWGDNASPGSIFHVALYTGNGRIIHAPRTGRPVTEESMYYWRTPDFYARP